MNLLESKSGVSLDMGSNKFAFTFPIFRVGGQKSMGVPSEVLILGWRRKSPR